MAELCRPSRCFPKLAPTCVGFNVACCFVCNLLNFRAQNHYFSQSAKIGRSKSAFAVDLVGLSSTVSTLK